MHGLFCFIELMNYNVYMFLFTVFTSWWMTTFLCDETWGCAQNHHNSQVCQQMSAHCSFAVLCPNNSLFLLVVISASRLTELWVVLQVLFGWQQGWLNCGLFCLCHLSDSSVHWTVDCFVIWVTTALTKLWIVLQVSFGRQPCLLNCGLFCRCHLNSVHWTVDCFVIWVTTAFTELWIVLQVSFEWQQHSLNWIVLQVSFGW